MIGNTSLHETSNVIGVRIVNFAMSDNLIVKNHKIRNYIWTYRHGKTYSQIDRIFIEDGSQVYLMSF
jgi:hypothetical protein